MAKSIPIRALHQIELTSRCSLRCVYCPSPKMGKDPAFRDKLDMPEDVFAACLDWLRFYVARGTQGEVNLAGIGESMMRDDFADLTARVRETVGVSTPILIATNGLHLTDALAARLATLGVRVYVSLHRPEKAGLAVAIAKRHGILSGVSADPSINANDWAGQVDWVNSGNRFTCPWLSNGWGFVAADGRILTCCLDATGKAQIGHVLHDAPGTAENHPTELCRKCYQDVPPDLAF